jgi:undecaprenyl-diphosphatase
VKFFFLATFAAAVPAIVSGGIAERARFMPQCAATALIVGVAYPVFEGITWNKNFGLQETLFAGLLGAEFHDFAGSIVVHAFGGWVALAAVLQLGAILAILTVYAARLIRMLVDLPSDPRARRFVGAILLVFLPAAVLGAGLHSIIKTVLFASPALVATMLVIGGIVLLWVDRLDLKPRYTDVMDYPLSLALKIGLCQCAAIVPGVSRSGATIVGALLLGTDKRSAAEFSFFLAMPTMAGAFAYDLYKNYAILKPDDITAIAIGFAVAFVSGAVVVRYLLDFVSRHGFTIFDWWRILVGGAALGALFVLG